MSIRIAILCLLLLTIMAIGLGSTTGREKIYNKRLYRDDTRSVEHKRVSTEQTKELECLQEEAFLLMEDTAKLNELLNRSKKNERERKPASISRDTHRGGNGYYFTTATERNPTP